MADKMSDIVVDEVNESFEDLNEYSISFTSLIQKQLINVNKNNDELTKLLIEAKDESIKQNENLFIKEEKKVEELTKQLIECKEESIKRLIQTNEDLTKHLLKSNEVIKDINSNKKQSEELLIKTKKSNEELVKEMTENGKLFENRLKAMNELIDKMETKMNGLNISLQNSDKQLEELRNEVKNTIPIGFVYTQLPNTKTPKEIWPQMEWNDISSQFENLFFRVFGDKSEPFSKIQEQNAPLISNIETRYTNQIVEGNRVWNQNTSNPTKGWGVWVYTGSDDVCKGHDIYIRFNNSGGEVRPQNIAIKLWQRIQ